MKKLLFILILFLPVSLFGQQLICKGGFESTDPLNPNCTGTWIQGVNQPTGKSDFRFGATSLRHGNTNIFTGNLQYAYLSNANGTGIDNGIGFVYQEITIPANTVSLTCTFWASISTSESNNSWAYDSLRIGYWDTTQKRHVGSIFLSNKNGEFNSVPHTYRAAYRQYSITADASLLNNQTANKLWFVISGYTDGTNPTVFRVDDISVIATVNNCLNPTPSITSNPSDARICRNSSQTFSITATNSDTYQWQFLASGSSSWQNISNATSNSYTIPSVQTANEGYYRCVASRSCGTSATSNSAYLKVDAARPSGVINSLNQAQRGAGHPFSTTFDVNTVISWNWAFQNASPSTSTDANPSVVFNKLGSQSATLTVDNACGSTSTSQNVQVQINPVNYPKIKQLHTRAKLKADPVNTVTGAYTHTEQDLSISGIKNLSFQHSYNGLNADKLTVLGYGWEHSFEYKLDLSDPDVITAYYPNSTRFYYQLADNKYTLLYQDVADSLIRNADNSFVLLQRDSTRLLFDTTGKITSILDAFDNPTTFSYGNNQLTCIESAGRGFNLMYLNGRLAQVKDGVRTVFFEYSANQDLIRSIVTQGTTERDTMEYEYENHLVTRIRDPRGTWFLKNQYVNGKVDSQSDAYDKKTQFIYPSVGQAYTRIIDPMLSTAYTTHDDNFNLIEDTDEQGWGERYTYYENGTLKSRTDANGNTTNFKTNYFGDVEGVTNALTRTSSIAYNNLGLPNVVTDMLNRQTRLFYKKNQVDSVILPNGGTIITRYNATGRPLSIKDPKGNVTTFVYHLTTGDPISVTTPAGTYNFSTDALGRLTSITEGNDLTKVWSMQYNHRDQITRLTSPIGFTEKEYDRNGNVIRERDFSGFYTNYEYDLKDRMTLIRNPKKQTTRLEYDALDRIKRIYDAENVLIWAGGYNRRGDLTSDTTVLGITNYAYENNRLLNKVTNALGKSVEIRYNPLNLPTTLIDELGRTTTLTYNNGNELERETYADNAYTDYAYSKLGLLQKVRDILRGENNLKYDLAGNLDTVQNARNKPNLTTYDGANRPTSTYDGVTRQRFGYTLAGLDTIWDGNGVRSIVSRNKNNEVLKVERTDNSFEEVRRNNDGLILTSKNENDSTTIERDSLHLPTKIRNGWGNDLQYTWSATGNVTQIVYPSGKIATYTYRKGTNLVDTVKWQGKVIGIYEYDSLGRNRVKRLGNGTSEKNEFDAANNLTLHRNSLRNGSIFQQNRREVDVMNRFVTNMDTVTSLMPKFAFGTEGGMFGDDDGITRLNGTTITSDGNGNITSVGNTEGYAWRNNRLLNYRREQDSAQFFYDAEGLKIRTLKNGQERRFIYDKVRTELPTLIETRNAQNQVIESYILGAFGEPILRDSAGTIHYFHFDANGHTIALTDTASRLTDRYTSDNFGAYARHEGATVQPFQFLGMYGVQYETENLYYVRERWLDTRHNRFLSKDPFPADLTNTQSNNRFVYAFNNPVSWVDASGLCATKSRIEKTIQKHSLKSNIERDLKAIDEEIEEEFIRDLGLSMGAFGEGFGQLSGFLYDPVQKKWRSTKNLKVYNEASFKGGTRGKVGSVTKVKALAKSATHIANGLTVAGVGLDAYSVYSSTKKNGFVSTETSAKFSDLAVGAAVAAASLTAAPAAAVVGVVYLADEAFFDGSTKKNVVKGVNWAGDKISNLFIKKR